MYVLHENVKYMQYSLAEKNVRHINTSLWIPWYKKQLLLDWKYLKNKQKPRKQSKYCWYLYDFHFFSLATGRSFHFFANIYHQKRTLLTNATCFYHETPVSKNFRVLNSILKRYGHPDISITNMKEIGMKLFKLLQSKIVSLWNRG